MAHVYGAHTHWRDADAAGKDAGAATVSLLWLRDAAGAAGAAHACLRGTAGGCETCRSHIDSRRSAAATRGGVVPLIANISLIGATAVIADAQISALEVPLLSELREFSLQGVT